MSGPEKLIEAEESSPGVTCAKCQHVNRHGRNRCENCGAHLHVVCHHCGHHNERSRVRCEACEHKLHRSWFKRLLPKDRRKNAAIAVLLVIAIILGFGLVVGFDKFFSLPST